MLSFQPVKLLAIASSRVCSHVIHQAVVPFTVVGAGSLSRGFSSTVSMLQDKEPNRLRDASLNKATSNTGNSSTKEVNGPGINNLGIMQTPELIKFQESLKKYRFINELFQKPKFNNYLIKLSQIGTIPTVISILILHELTAVIPLLLIWYLLYQLNWECDLERNKLLKKCHESMARVVGDKYPSLNKENLIISGTIAFAAVKVMGPLRLLATVWLAPSFGRKIILPICNLWKR